MKIDNSRSDEEHGQAPQAQIEVPDGYELRQSVEFLAGFTPQPVIGTGVRSVELRFVSPLPPCWEPVEVVVTQVDRMLHVKWTGPGAAEEIVENVTRILSLDVDGTGFAELILEDPVLAEVLDLGAPIRPPLFWSAYEAAVWAVLSQRVSMRQATALKHRLASEHGAGSVDRPATPGPERLLSVRTLPGINSTKLDRLHAVAQAAVDGKLDAGELRGASTADALRELESIRGIGPFSAGLILVRGAGAPDVFPPHEQRLHSKMRQIYDRPDAPPAELEQIADAWRPFRSWVSFQIRRLVEF